MKFYPGRSAMPKSCLHRWKKMVGVDSSAPFAFFHDGYGFVLFFHFSFLLAVILIVRQSNMAFGKDLISWHEFILASKISEHRDQIIIAKKNSMAFGFWKGSYCLKWFYPSWAAKIPDPMSSRSFRWYFRAKLWWSTPWLAKSLDMEDHP